MDCYEDDQEHEATSSSANANPAIPAITRLITHFVSSKRSLSSASHVYRANEIVDSARASLEDIAALHARNRFLRAGIDGTLAKVKLVRWGVEEVAERVGGDFKETLQRLDTADAGIKQTLNTLKTTQVEPSFRPDIQELKYLYDFVDEQGVDALTNVFHDCIDETNAAQDGLAEAIASFDEEIRAVENAMAGSSITDTATIAKGKASDDLNVTASTFHALESHATEMAQHLQSLVRHYDLCMTALKHTEGGGEAAEQALVNLVPAEVVTKGMTEETANVTILPAPISEEEKAEMLKVLENDANEVGDVVEDIKEHAAEMEMELEHITSALHNSESTQRSLLSTIRLLESLGSRLTTYIAASEILQRRWQEQKVRIEEKMEELEGVRLFYGGFLEAYDGLIVEIARRKKVKAAMDAIVKGAMEEVKHISEADLEERESFKSEQGAFLPSDLWPALMDGPSRYEIVPLHPGSTTLPEISAEAMQRALQRSALRD